MSETILWGIIGLIVVVAAVVCTILFMKKRTLPAWGAVLVSMAFIVIIVLQIYSPAISGKASPAVNATATPIAAQLPAYTSEPESSELSSEPTSTIPMQGVIAAGYDFTVALKSDGTVVCVGGNDEIYVENWEGIQQIAAYGNHILGLYWNGTVAFTGMSESGERNVSNWTDIAQVSACYKGSIGLTNDGHVLYTGFDRNKISDCENWSGIAKILGGEDHVVALTNTGNIVTSGYNGGGSGDGRRQDFNFSNVVEGDAASGTTFCVFSDGSVAAYGTDWAGEDMIGGWSNIVAISGGDEHTVGLKKDGTVVAMGSNQYGQCDVKGWSDIIAIVAGQFHTVGLKSDGTLVATGLNDRGQCNVSGIHLW